MNKMLKKFHSATCLKIAALFCALISICLLTSCVDQSGPSTEKAVEGNNARLIATSSATADICDRLNLDLVGVCETEKDLPGRYADLPRVGMAMNPDLEVIKSLNPDYILSPVTLKNDLEPKYQTIGTEYIFLDLRSVKGMYASIDELGKKFGHEKEAKELNDEFDAFMKEYEGKNKDKEKPRVLVLMGLPGSYIVATENSYVGSLVELAGGENVFAGTDEEFLTVNSEDLKTKEPDVIVRAAHAMPEDVKQMFADEFKDNQIWKHFKAVQDGRVYDLDSRYFNMSATFGYKKALEMLQPMLYGEE